MVLLENGDNPDTGSTTSKIVGGFWYLGAVLSIKNDWSKVTKAERAAFALSNSLKSKLFSNKTKTRICTAVIRVTLIYGCEAWTTTSTTEIRLRTFENKI